MSDDTTAQVRDLSRSLLMSSGAGCGKTYRMVERYTHLVKTGAPVSKIVAVTFTEKAAAELKDRVRQECRRLETEDAARAAVWQEAARGLEMAPIGTIHSFCARLLRENALAAGVDPRFTQLDEREQRTLLRDVSRESLLGRLRSGEEGARAIIARWGLDGALGVIREAVGKREEYRELLGTRPSAAKFVARWEEFAAQAPARLLAALTADERWLEIVAAMTEIAPGDPSDKAAVKHLAFLDALSGVDDDSRDDEERLTSLKECVKQAGGGVGAKGKWPGREDDLVRLKNALKLLTEFNKVAGKQIERMSVVEGEAEAELAAAVCIEAAVAAEAYASAKRDRSALDFEDLQILARDLLRDNRTIRERVGARYDHVLVDEFQDTNALQKEIVWHVAGGDVNAGAPPAVGKLFVVGDAKQSIYAFRSADVSVFNATRRDFAEVETCDVLGLEESRRSTPGLVAFHNDLFGNPAVMGEDNAPDFQASYEPISAWRGELTKDHDVEVMLVEEGESVAEGRATEARALAERIAWMVEDGERIVAEERVAGPQTPRPVRYGDIAILMRAMPNVTLYEAALRRRNIPYYTLAGRGFYNRQEIRDCLSLLSVLENASDNLALASVLRCSAFAISDDTLLWLRRDGGTLWEALGVADRPQVAPAQLRRLARAHQILSALRADKNRLSLSELVERMLDETGLGAAMLTQLGGLQVAANLMKLTDMARAFEAEGSFSLREFIDYLGNLVTEEEREGLAGIHAEAGDVVQIMTIHKAKGMQWPVVIVPDLNRGQGGSSEGLSWSATTGPVPRIEDEAGARKPGAVRSLLRLDGEQREEAELRRLLYVALTRAEDHLVLSSSYNVDDDGSLKGPGKWLRWVADALALDTLPLDGASIGGDAWRGIIRRPRPSEGDWAGPTTSSRAELSVIPEALAGAVSRSDAAAEELRSRIEPVGTSSAGMLQAHVTALSGYLACPHSYWLRHVLDLPERSGSSEWLRGVSATERGDLAHKIMELVGRDGEDEFERNVELATFPDAVGQRMPTDELATLSAGIRAFLRGDLYTEWVATAARLRTEVPFTAELAGAIIEGKIDALVEGPDGALRVLDYKTGQVREDNRDYDFQVGLYCAAVQVATGRLPKRAAVVHLDVRDECIYDDIESLAGAALERARTVVEGIGRDEFGMGDCAGRGGCALAYACKLT